MKIAVVAVAAESFGALSVLQELYNAASCHTEYEWVFLLSAPYVQEQENITVRLFPDCKENWMRRLKWELFFARDDVERTGADIVLSLQNLVVFRSRKPQILYLQNVIPFQHVKHFSLLKKEERYYAVYQHLIGRLIRFSSHKADRVIVQSNWLKRVLLETTRTGCDCSTYVLPTLIDAHDIVPVSLCSGEPVSLRHFLYPAAPTLFKNHTCIVEAVKLLESRGYDDFTVEFTFLDETHSYSDPHIRCIGALPRKELFAHYKDCVLLYPSYIESYGMPLAEAKLAGAVILAADCEYAHELLDGYQNIRFFDPFQPKQLCCLLQEILDGKMRYQAVTAKTLNDANWDSIVDVVQELYEERSKT